MYTGPEVSGSRPVLVTFEVFKDREEVCSESLFCSNTGSLTSSPGAEKGKSAEGKQYPHQ